MNQLRRAFVAVLALPLRVGLVLLFVGVQPASGAGFQTNSIDGWRVLVNERLVADDKAVTEKALGLLRLQLQEIVRVVPAPAVAKLREVTLWLSPEYPGVRPTAEYHPGADWLRDNGRNPAMAKGVEITDVRDFEAETKRMPNFILHELAHGYHDRFLPRGFDNPEIAAAYQRAKASGSYDQVQRWLGTRFAPAKEKAYAMTNPMEYFAESTEAFFSRNDFFPFNREELKQHDPEMEKLLERLWNPPAAQAGQAQIKPPPPELKVPAFYTKYFDAGGYPIVASARVNDHDHNHVNTRALLIEYDPGLAGLCREVFGDTELKYTKPATRLRDHLAGYDPSPAPAFAWPDRLVNVRSEIKQAAVNRSKAAEKSPAE